MCEGQTLERDRKDENRQTLGWKDRKCIKLALYATTRSQSIGKRSNLALMFRKIILFRRLAGCGDSGRCCDGSTVG